MAVALLTTNLRLTEKKTGKVVYTISQVATEKEGSLSGFWLVGYIPETGEFRKYTLAELEAKD